MHVIALDLINQLVLKPLFAYCDSQISVEQGLMELRKLGIEHRLWEASRKEIEQDTSISAAQKIC